MPYPTDLLQSRAFVRPGLCSLITGDGVCVSVIPGIENCNVNVLATPKVGANFTEYHMTAQPGGGTSAPFCKQAEAELFFFVIEGQASVKSEGHAVQLDAGGYLYVPPGKGLEFVNIGSEAARYLLYKQRYTPLDERRPHFVDGNIHTAPMNQETDHMSSLNLLPNKSDLAFDMSFNVLSFAPGGSHSYLETHMEEHGLYILSGEAMYYVDDHWLPVKKDDFIWFGPFCPQVTYQVGPKQFTYIFSKDANRDPEL